MTEEVITPVNRMTVVQRIIALELNWMNMARVKIFSISSFKLREWESSKLVLKP